MTLVLKNQLFTCFAVLTFILSFQFGYSQNQTLKGVKEGVVTEIRGSYNDGSIDGYLLYLPRTFDAKKEYPVLIFLQGGLGVGGTPMQVISWGIPKVLNDPSVPFKGDHLLRDSFIVVSPHMIEGPFRERQWFLQEKGMKEIIAEVSSNFKVDSDRIYLTGLSRGGAGTWGLASRLKDTFAAIVPICGVINGITEFDNLSTLPIWVAHNDGDGIVDYSESVKAVNQIEENNKVKFLRLDTPDASKFKYKEAKRIFSTFDQDNHDAWSAMYEREEIYIWLLSKRR
jgi:predicted peptidase